MEGILGLIGTVLGLLLWWFKHRDSPEAIRKRIIEEAKDDLEKMDNALARGDVDDITRLYADLRRRLQLETSGDNRTGADSKD